MAKTSDTVKGSAFTPKGTMPKDKLILHKLIGNFPHDGTIRASYNKRRAIKNVRMISSYRLAVQKVIAPKLAKSLVLTAHYFATENSRADSDNPKDRKGLDIAPPVSDGISGNASISKVAAKVIEAVAV